MVGNYGVIKTNGFFGKLIRLGTMSRWNHAVIAISDTELVEATPRGVIISQISEYPLIAWNQHEDIKDRQLIADYAKSLVSEPYGFGDILNLALRILGLKIISNTRLIEYLAVKRGVICSELVALCYEHAGVSFDKPAHLITPGDLAERIIYQ